MRKRRYKILLATVLTVSAVSVFNASWRVPAGEPELRLIAHRGIHQTFPSDGLQSDTCTAARIHPPTHDYIENTIRSMQAAFAAGADIVEFDVHPTIDGKFAVLHDWIIDCRTEGHGVTREHGLAYLQSLDIGYGYTADGGNSFPLRGRGVGLMPELREVFTALPGGRFLVNFKSREAREGDMLAALMDEHPEWRSAVWGIYGGDEPTFRAAELLGSGVKAWSRRSLIDCLGRYIAIGWTGIMPDACKGTVVMIPANAAPWLWGWPNLLLQRFHAAGSEVILLGPFSSGDPGTAGIDTLEELARVPSGFSGYLWTNKIEVIGPAVKR
ncbi:MAG: glycerophosphodiester phosphodiesterase [Candidatus Accumulibacter sp.]|jgi:glycerophosphoryl diester phosphodiesterase|nr:glycerophosphodiester phosphodiesterase [Accumulibacter sp.]